MSNYNNLGHTRNLNYSTNINSRRREIINFSSTIWTDSNGPSLDLTQSTWTTSNGDTATLTDYTGSNNFTYNVNIGNNTTYLKEVAGEETYTHTYHTTDGGPAVEFVQFIAPNTLIFRDPNSNFIQLNDYVRLFVDTDELTVQIKNNLGNYVNKLRVV